MKATKDEAIQMLIELADYVDSAVIYLDEEEIHVEEGKVYKVICDVETGNYEFPEIASVGCKKVNNIVEFIKKFIEFSKATGCIVDPMSLHTPDPVWEWVVNARAYCGTAMVRYMDATRLIIDIDKERDALMKIGFEPMPPKGVLMYF